MDIGWLKTAEGVTVYALMHINLNSVMCKSGDCSTFRLFSRFCICGTCPISSLNVDACHLFSAGVGFLVLLLILCACVKSKFSAEKQFSSVGPSSRAESICRRNKNFFCATDWTVVVPDDDKHFCLYSQRALWSDKCLSNNNFLF